jgi:hypothetical protein
MANYSIGIKKMREINIDVGKNISDTARNSGVPRYATETHWGLTIYELVDLDPKIIVNFRRIGYEIAITSLFSLTMYADSENKNNMAVEKIELQFGYKAKTHQEAKIFVEGILKQFNDGKWRRYIRETCPAVSGRSAYLDEMHKIDNRCSLDPHYRPSIEDWVVITRTRANYQWLGDGVFANLDVGFDEDPDGLTFNINLEFRDFGIYDKRTTAAQARELLEGDQKGWKSTEDYNKRMKENLTKIKILEANALRRGDHVVSRDKFAN